MKSPKLRRFLRLMAVAALLTCGAGDARADDGENAATDPAVEARQQYAAGSQAYAAKRFVEAALHFEAAASHRAHAVTLYTAALAWEQASRPERACDDYGRALEVPGLSTQQAANARDRVATLEKTLGTLALMAPLGESGWRVQLEGLSEVEAPARLHAMPGIHQLLVRAPNGSDNGLHLVLKREVTLELGQTMRLELEPEPSVAAVKAPAVKPESRAAAPEKRVLAAPISGGLLRRSAGLVTAGFGVAALGAGTILGIEALDARDAYNTAPTRAALDHAHGLQTWTTVAFVFGAALTAGGIFLVLLPDARPAGNAARITIGPNAGGATLRGSF